ncbi:MAG: patatin-like phospholipase family protein [Sulfuriferula sp.]
MKPIRVALSGSGFKFPAHVGALAAINDAGYEVREIAGTSGGSIIAALYASGMSLDTMKNLAMEKDWSDFLTFNPWSLLTKMGYCSGNTLYEWLEDNMGVQSFSTCRIPLTIMATDVANYCAIKFSRETTPTMTLAQAARASAAIPLVYAPVQYGDALCFDGGMENNIPVDQLKIDGMPRIGIQLVTKAAPMKPGVYTIKTIIPRLIGMMLAANENTHVEIGQLSGAQVAFVETGYVDGLNTNMNKLERAHLYQDGYSATWATLLGARA